ncbi:MAG TPA: MotA/TolQ/ExbB proton channel family protein [Phycisphaerae bacterium]|nr:MotA/TolQ/ExbB proton channel family protein [Phycisphaerae bacterium]
MDIATIVGVILGIVILVLAIGGGEGGGAELFVNVPSVLITIGGMFAATLVHFSLGQILRITSVVKKALLCRLPAEMELIQKMVNYAAISRRDGALALEEQITGAGDPFLVKGLQMIIDGQKEEDLEGQLSMEIQYLRQRHAEGKQILEFMGSSAPAWGMIGTLIGLVLMLSKLDNPSEIGAGMATALLTTFYGALVANLVCIPMAGKLGLRSKKESMLSEMTLQGLLAVVRGESPTSVREKMQAFISARSREELKPNV